MNKRNYKVSVVACIDKNGIIGVGGHIPWMSSVINDDKTDMRHFSQLTRKSVCIVGKTTFTGDLNGIGLPERKMVVMDGNGLDRPFMSDINSIPRMHLSCRTAAEVLDKIDLFDFTGPRTFNGTGPWQTDRVYVIGGGAIYREFMESGLVDEIFLTVANYDCGDSSDVSKVNFPMDILRSEYCELQCPLDVLDRHPCIFGQNSTTENFAFSYWWRKP
jgi:dihydrofolate reductase